MIDARMSPMAICDQYGKLRFVKDATVVVRRPVDHPDVPYAYLWWPDGYTVGLGTVWETDREPATGCGGDVKLPLHVKPPLHPIGEYGPDGVWRFRDLIDQKRWDALQAELAESMTACWVRMACHDMKQAQKVADVLRRPGTRPLHWEVDFSVVPEPVMVDPKELWSPAPLPEAARSCGCLAPAGMLQWTECPVSPDQCRWRRLSEKS